MIVKTCARLSYLRHPPVVVHARKSFKFWLLKLVVVGFYVGLQVALIALAASTGSDLAPQEQTYIAATILFDIAQTHARWLSLPMAPSTKVFTMSLVVKIIVLILESQHKTRWIQIEDGKEKNRNPELTSGIFNRSFYFWLNRLLLRGYRFNLGIDDLFSLDNVLAVAYLNRSRPTERSRYRLQFNRLSLKRPKPTLLETILWTLKWPFLAPVLPDWLLGVSCFRSPS
jgi:hypothetical protein